jgi:hypothetical protein
MIGCTNALGAKRTNPIPQPSLAMAFNGLKKSYKLEKNVLSLIKELLKNFC